MSPEASRRASASPAPLVKWAPGLDVGLWEGLRGPLPLMIADNFRLAMRTFWGHRLRSVLTLLGIVIGVATVVSMMALLRGPPAQG